MVPDLVQWGLEQECTSIDVNKSKLKSKQRKGRCLSGDTMMAYGHLQHSATIQIYARRTGFGAKILGVPSKLFLGYGACSGDKMLPDKFILVHSES